jgi:hypothetical protein
MPATIDLTGVSTEGKPPLEPDIYPAVITKADIHDSKSSGEPTLYLELSVGEDARNGRWSTSLQQQSLFRLKRMLVNLGLEVPEGPFEFDEQDLIGVECSVRTILEQHYKDPQRKTWRIAEILSPDGESGDGEGNWG